MSNRIIAGLDIGNGYVKGMASSGRKEPTVIDMPSCVLSRYVIDATDLKTSGEQVAEVVEDIFNRMDVVFSTPLVEDSRRTVFGRRAVKMGKSVTEFDIQAIRKSKAEKPLTAMLVLGCLAGKALQDYYAKNGKLPDATLSVEARIAVALPIDEYKQHYHSFAAKFKSGTHLVTFYNFEQLVRVEITVTDVQVLAEGASAQYAIGAKGRPLMDAMLADVRARGVALEGVTGDDILAAQSTVGIDIGEGTVNFPVYQGGRFDPDSSMTYPEGYGTVLDEVLTILQRDPRLHLPFNSRKSLSEFLQAPVTRGNKAIREKVDETVAVCVRNFADDVAAQFSKLIGKVGIYTEVVYVYGGGATAMKDVLYPALLKVVSQMGGQDALCPVLYLDSGYSRKLNREGLYLVARQMADYEDAQSKKD